MSRKKLKIHAPDTWIKQANELVDKALRHVAFKLHEEHGNSVPFPMFLHVCLYYSIDNIYKNAPSEKEADEFIKQTFDQMKEHNNDTRIN